MAFYQIEAGSVKDNYYMLGTTATLTVLFQVLGLWSHLKDVFFLGLEDLTATIL